jgi:hypothetical protein
MVDMVNRPDNSSYYSPDPKMSTANGELLIENRPFAKPLIDNHLHEIDEIGPEKRRSRQQCFLGGSKIANALIEARLVTRSRLMFTGCS